MLFDIIIIIVIIRRFIDYINRFNLINLISSFFRFPEPLHHSTVFYL